MMLCHLEEEVKQEERQQQKIKDIESSEGVNKGDSGVRIILILLIFPVRRAQRNREDLMEPSLSVGISCLLRVRAPKFKEGLFFDLGEKINQKKKKKKKKKKKNEPQYHGGPKE